MVARTPAALLFADVDAALTRVDELAGVEDLPHCREAVTALLQGRDPAYDHELSRLEEAQCAFSQQFALSVSDVDDALVDALTAHLTEAEVWRFTVAVYLIDLDVRVSLVAGAVL